MFSRLRTNAALQTLVKRQFQKRTIAGVVLPSDAAAPTVLQKVVNVCLVDFEGNRHFVQGRAGQTLMQACAMNKVQFLEDDSDGGGGAYDAFRDSYYTESLFGEGAVSPRSHVVVANEWAAQLPPANHQERHILDTYVPRDDLMATSRLATEIVLNKNLDGLVVAVPEAPPTETYVYHHEYEDDDDDEETH